MDKKVRKAVFLFTLGVFASSGPALAIDDADANASPWGERNAGHFLSLLEPNARTGVRPQVISQQGDLSVVTTGSVTTITGVMGVRSGTQVPDIDVFQFYAEPGSMVTIQVGPPAGATATRLGFSSILAVFSPKEDGYQNRRESMATPEGGDPVLEKVDLNIQGMWSVVLSPHEMTFGNGGVLDNTSKFNKQNGAYQLVITAVAPPVEVKHIVIAVKPGSGERAPINTNARGVIPVALLSGEGFNPQAVDVASLKFGATGEEINSLRSCSKDLVDLNSDGVSDLVCHFENQKTNFTAESTEGILKGKFTNANGQEQPIVGTGALKVRAPKLAN
jgi:hypothetical protein